MTIVVDSSAIVAILKGEPEARVMSERMLMAPDRIISAGTYMECGAVVLRYLGKGGSANLRRLVDRLGIEIVPVTPERAHVGIEAYRRFGRGSGHTASLNFGDCFAYALARTRDLPLLFKGDVFVHTDVEPALKPT